MMNVLCIAFLSYIKLLFGGLIMVVNNQNIAISKLKVLVFNSMEHNLFLNSSV
jgi:hypothetical protein